MSRTRYLPLLCLLLTSAAHSPAAEPAKGAAAKRAPWTTSHIKGSPEKPLPYVTERAFPKLKFKD